MDIDRLQRCTSVMYALVEFEVEQILEEGGYLRDVLSGTSVTRRIKQVTQPRGGYVKSKDLEAISLGDGIETLNQNENVHASLIGMTVDYLTRVMTGTSTGDAFAISLLGAEKIAMLDLAESFLCDVDGLDDTSIVSAIRLSGFDVCYRSGVMHYKPVQNINPDTDTIENVRTMVKRSLRFLNEYGPKTLDGFTFEGGYTKIVSAGDGDFMTEDTLWDFKVSKVRPTKDHTLQLLMYWRMGLYSIHPEFQNVRYLGIYNPRMNKVFRIAVADIPQDVIDEVETEVIGY